MKCRYCGEKCIKKGVQQRKQRYQCKECKKYQQNSSNKIERNDKIPVQMENIFRRFTGESTRTGTDHMMNNKDLNKVNEVPEEAKMKNFYIQNKRDFYL